ncbi:hypothetical protein ABZT06_50020, partial [Streptomyces sp. NPDC005483]|uniref:hypothetical protein n=1 Tax=Streptomyces sp. NPDC005483 TaxID=3154882 RepID=UPI0033BDEC0F
MVEDDQRAALAGGVEYGLPDVVAADDGVRAVGDVHEVDRALQGVAHGRARFGERRGPQARPGGGLVEVGVGCVVADARPERRA